MDELSVDPGRPSAATQLIALLLVSRSGEDAAPEARKLSMHDRDLVLAALYRHLYGDQIESVVRCRGCGTLVEASFSLAALIAHRVPDYSAGRPDGAGGFVTTTGLSFRVPTVADREEAAALPPADALDQLVKRCLGRSGTTQEICELQERLDEVAPLLDLDVAVSCPHCGRRDDVRFSIGRFTIEALARESRLLPLEIHRLAVAYGWPFDQIVALDRSLRRSLLRCVEAERNARRRA
ncbi:hypothetical protein [Bradyrhizobium japonicum]|uniref:T4 family baseplate hub assembly chaperone n=1 Tax=Bradyrhizobium japonicum TaxID=375 RepID=UPI0004223FB3|nr:hypothetical protein [Bradyrhizobium japonicum]WLB91308.1 hypothetical protein QIH91_13350 [Bradyrhizobium japonicum USDA 135]